MSSEFYTVATNHELGDTPELARSQRLFEAANNLLDMDMASVNATVDDRPAVISERYYPDYSRGHTTFVRVARFKKPSEIDPPAFFVFGSSPKSKTDNPHSLVFRQSLDGITLFSHVSPTLEQVMHKNELLINGQRDILDPTIYDNDEDQLDYAEKVLGYITTEAKHVVAQSLAEKQAKRQRQKEFVLKHKMKLLGAAACIATAASITSVSDEIVDFFSTMEIQFVDSSSTQPSPYIGGPVTWGDRWNNPDNPCPPGTYPNPYLPPGYNAR